MQDVVEDTGEESLMHRPLVLEVLVGADEGKETDGYHHRDARVRRGEADGVTETGSGARSQGHEARVGEGTPGTTEDDMFVCIRCCNRMLSLRKSAVYPDFGLSHES